MTVGLIWAEASGGIIGNDGAMPWHLPEDLARFKALTSGSPVIMGRKTWDSLNPRFRPLPGRRNIVVTRRGDWHEAGAETAHSVEEALALAGVTDAGVTDAVVTDAGATDSAGPVASMPVPSVWVIGGAEIFAMVMHLADRLEVTEILAEVEGDTLAPAIDDAWAAVATDPAGGWHKSRTGLDYRFLTYQRR
jgi:dihydrofolate reductase